MREPAFGIDDVHVLTAGAARSHELEDAIFLLEKTFRINRDFLLFGNLGYFTFTAIHSEDKFLNEQQILRLNFKPHLSSCRTHPAEAGLPRNRYSFAGSSTLSPLPGIFEP